MTTHTPGPWSDPLTYGVTKFEIQGGGKKIAVVETIPDALLIAAAPELLAALQLMIGTTPYSASREWVVHRALLAIAKATTTRSAS